MAKKKFNLDKDALYKKLMPSNTAEVGEEAVGGGASPSVSVSETSRYISEQLLSSSAAAQETASPSSMQQRPPISLETEKETAETVIHSANVQIQPETAVEPAIYGETLQLQEESDVADDKEASSFLQELEETASPNIQDYHITEDTPVSSSEEDMSQTTTAFTEQEEMHQTDTSAAILSNNTASDTTDTPISTAVPTTAFEEGITLSEENMQSEEGDEAFAETTDDALENMAADMRAASETGDNSLQNEDDTVINEADIVPMTDTQEDAVSEIPLAYETEEADISEEDAQLATMEHETLTESKYDIQEAEPVPEAALDSAAQEPAVPKQTEAPKITEKAKAETPPAAVYTTPPILKQRSELDFKNLSILMPVNLTEKIVRSHISLILRDHSLCNCSRCQMDATSIALNKITTKYISWFSSDQALSDFYYKTHFAEIMSAMLLACSIVKNAPRHAEQFQVPEKNLRVHNIIEDLVAAQIKKMLPSYDGCCCDHCLSDIAALMLNHIPAKYTITTEGKLFAKLVLMEQQYHVDMTTQFIKASHIVQTAPNH